MDLRAFVALLSSVALCSCASTTRMRLSVDAPQREVYNATMKALATNGFQVQHTDRESAIITADRPVREAITNREADDR